MQRECVYVLSSGRGVAFPEKKKEYCLILDKIYKFRKPKGLSWNVLADAIQYLPKHSFNSGLDSVC